jgi:hypothetical protein
VTVVTIGIAITSYFAGKSGAEREYAAQAERRERETLAERQHEGIPIDEAARIAADNLSKLGVPTDRYVLSVETSYSYSKPRELRYLVRLWPPWPVSQPEDRLRAWMWRAIEVTADGRCYLTAVNQPGSDPLQADPTKVPDFHFWDVPAARTSTGTMMFPPAATPTLYDSILPAASTRRRVILPPPD